MRQAVTAGAGAHVRHGARRRDADRHQLQRRHLRLRVV